MYARRPRRDPPIVTRYELERAREEDLERLARSLGIVRVFEGERGRRDLLLRVSEALEAREA